MIKLIPRDFSEDSIIKFLMSESVRQDEYNTTIPILEVLEFDERWSFIVMPRYFQNLRLKKLLSVAYNYVGGVVPLVYNAGALAALALL